KDLVDYYQTLCERYTSVAFKVVKVPNDKAVRLESLEKYFDGALVCGLSPEGRLLTTEAFATQMQQWMETSRCVRLIIGNAFGFDDRVKDRFSRTISLSPMTLTHELAAVVILEQIYRAMNMKAGGSYH